MGTKELTPEELNRLRRIAYTKLYFNPRWWWQNAGFALASRDDTELAFRYVLRILNNYFVRGMRHTH